MEALFTVIPNGQAKNCITRTTEPLELLEYRITVYDNVIFGRKYTFEAYIA